MHTLKSYTQEEFDEIYRLHNLYLRVNKDGVKADLSNSDLTNLNLKGLNLSDVDLSGSDLRGMDLSETCFKFTDLRRAKLDRSSLYNTNFEFANLNGTTLNSVEYLNSAMLYGSIGLLVICSDRHRVVLVSRECVNIGGPTQTFERALERIWDNANLYEYGHKGVERYEAILKFMQSQAPLYYPD